MQQKRTTTIALVTVIACVANLGLNLWLVPQWGMFGAAVSTLAAYIAQASVMYAFVRTVARKLYSSKLIIGNLAIFAVLLLLVEIPWSSTAEAYVLPAALLIAAAGLWPLGLNRVGRACRASMA
jgi:O-antigen/teichoic acid export membrane protein